MWYVIYIYIWYIGNNEGKQGEFEQLKKDKNKYKKLSLHQRTKLSTITKELDLLRKSQISEQETAHNERRILQKQLSQAERQLNEFKIRSAASGGMVWGSENIAPGSGGMGGVGGHSAGNTEDEHAQTYLNQLRSKIRDQGSASSR